MQKNGFLESWSFCAIPYCLLYFVAGVIQCSDHTVVQAEHGNHLLSRHPRATDAKASTANSFGNAVSFTGGEVIKLRLDGDASLPNKEFSVQFWLKPEGGQYRFTPIIDVHDDDCSVGTTGWMIGIGLPAYSRKNARVFFSLQTENAQKSSILFAHKAYETNTWTNIAATYNGSTMKLYMNGAEVSLQEEQDGVVFRPSVANCAGLHIGGRQNEDLYYRGKLDEFGIWGRVLSHSEIVNNINRQSSDFPVDSLLAENSFDNLDLWDILSDESSPKLMPSDIVLPYHTVRLEAPSCGRTVCDDPEVVLSYLKNEELRHWKRVRYRVINILDDNGKKPQVYDKQIQEQHKALEKAFGPYNISFELHVHRVRNTSLSQKVVMFDCHPSRIGNGHCDEECAHSTTGNDGGDCDHIKSECKKALLGNGQCNSECNKAYYNYDEGDCCKSLDDMSYRTCVDPKNAQRGYMNIEEVKMELQLEDNDEINIFFITSSWDKDTFRGLATYPWEKNVYSTMGGIVMHVDVFGRLGKTKSLVHEFGHIFGLWHVHRGISEMTCDDPCAEIHPSMVLGDLCSDTNPTPRNSYCGDPSQLLEETGCGYSKFENTPYRNYMSYGDDACVDQFTPQQEARMHCYLDLVYQPLREMKRPVPVPVAPKIVQVDSKGVHLVWLEPLGLDRDCDTENALHQYAYTATASHSGVRYAPHEATGFPDAESCVASTYAWKPYHSHLHPECDFDSCWIELGFKQPVVPKRVNVWVADIREDSDIYVEVFTVEEESIPVGDIPAYCDMETSVLVNTHNKLINRVKIYVVDSHIAIDAVELVSEPGFPKCKNRKSPKYKVQREPPFTDGVITTNDNQLLDSTVILGVKYVYSVQASEESRYSVSSPELVYVHGQPFCGDGLSSSEEECDDENAVDGDGCSMDCKVEEGFQCKGSPSLCSVSTSVSCDETRQVCSLDPPDGFIDQWAVDANANPEYQGAECPVSIITGKPEKIQKCVPEPEEDFWRPCGEFVDISGDFWIQVQIYKPVVAVAVIIHLASDGRSVFDQEHKSLHVALVNTDDSIVSLTPKGIIVTCERNPVFVPVIQDLSKPFHLTKGVRISFTYSSIGIYSVRVRSSPHINPPGIASCASNELYYPQHGVCINDKCSKKSCGDYPVKYGEAICSGLDDGDSCKIQCDRGYFVDGHDNKAVCVDGVWVTASPLICSPVDCGRPQVKLASVACSDGTTYSNKCHFKCDKPALLLGDDTSLTCQRNGRWSKPKAECVIQCHALDSAAYNNGKLKTSSCVKGPQPIGTQCKVRCQEGFHVEEERSQRRFLRIICNEDGEWFGPKCVPNTCPSLPRMFTGAYTCTDGFQSGSTCTMSCSDDFVNIQTVTCSKGSEWIGGFRLCPEDKDKTCLTPTSKENVEFICDGTHPVTNLYSTVNCPRNRPDPSGAECSVVCPDGRNPVLNNLKPSSKEQFDNRIECTVLQKWEPEPSYIRCVQPCDKWSVNDGFCDAANNRDVCDWDGGDCCPSTVQGGLVLPMSEDCTTECQCNDPLAIENRKRKRRHKHPYWLSW